MLYILLMVIVCFLKVSIHFHDRPLYETVMFKYTYFAHDIPTWGMLDGLNYIPTLGI